MYQDILLRCRLAVAASLPCMSSDMLDDTVGYLVLSHS